MTIAPAAQRIITQFNMQPHPEGGYYAETWRASNEGRATGTCIYFLLTERQASHWHRVDATEIWFYHAGAPLILSTSPTDAGPAQDQYLTADLSLGTPQVIIPENHWQAARSTEDWTLEAAPCHRGLSLRDLLSLPPGLTYRAPSLQLAG